MTVGLGGEGYGVKKRRLCAPHSKGRAAGPCARI
jgi:hypothetical protein